MPRVVAERPASLFSVSVNRCSSMAIVRPISESCPTMWSRVFTSGAGSVSRAIRSGAPGTLRYKSLSFIPAISTMGGTGRDKGAAAEAAPGITEDLTALSFPRALRTPSVRLGALRDVEAETFFGLGGDDVVARR